MGRLTRLVRNTCAGTSFTDLHSAARTVLIVLLAIAFGSPACCAQDPAPAPAPHSQSADDPDSDGFREKTIYIPYEDLRKVFEREGRGVFLPYPEFQKLWRAARSAETRQPEAKPPVPSVVAEMSATATVARDVVKVEAKLRIELLRKGWHEVNLRLGDAAITGALIAGQPARIAPAANGGYALIVRNQADTAKVVELDLNFAKALTKSPGRNSVSFAAPAAPVSRWDIRIPEPGVRVDIHPLVAATDVPADAEANETRLLAFVGGAPAVRIEWTPKAEGAKGLAALASVLAEQRTTIDEGVTRTRTTLAYTISRAELTQLVVEAPAGQKIVNVFDPNIREWSVEPAGAWQRVTAQLFEPAREQQNLVLELERFADEEEVEVPVVRAVDVGRQQGVVAVRVSGGLRAEPVKRENLLQLDAAELPPGLASGNWDFAYRYAALPYGLAMRVEKIQPRIIVDTLVEAHINPDSATLNVLSVHDVQRAGVFQLYFEVPEGWDVRNVYGQAVTGAGKAEVEGHHRVEDRPGILAVDLSRQARGRTALAITLYRKLNEPDLLTPTGKNALIAVPVPRADPTAVFRQSGRLVVYGPESLRFNPRQVNGLRVISQAEAVAGMISTFNSNTERPVMAFAFSDEPGGLSVEAERRKPHVTVRQFLTARIASGVVKFESVFFCEVLYSGIKGLRIDVPADLAEDIRVTAGGIRHAVIDEPADRTGLAEGYVAWRLAGETEFLGTVRIPMAWEQKIDQLDVGGSVEIAIPRLMPMQVDRAWGQIALDKAESIDVTPTEQRSGLRAIDPQQDLMPGAKAPNAARAFEFHDDWSLTVKATRYEAKDVKATSIDRALVCMVVTRGELTSVQALYRMRSARQRLTVKLPEGTEFDTQPLHVNGRPAPLEQGNGNDFFIPLTGQNQKDSFLVELRYVVRGAGSRLECPSFPLEPAIQQVYLAAYLPEERSYLGARGPWNDEFVWVLRGFTSWPRGNRSRESVYEWIAKDLPVNVENLSNFAVDGRYLLFSTLRPPAAPEGNLSLVSMRSLMLQVLVLVVGIGIGLALLRATFRQRVLVIGLLITGALVLAVCLPSLTRALCTNGTVVGAMIVVIIWVLWYLLVTRPRDPLVRARARLRERTLQAARESEPQAKEPPPPDDRASDNKRPPNATPAATSPPPSPRTEENKIASGNNKGGDEDGK